MVNFPDVPMKKWIFRILKTLLFFFALILAGCAGGPPAISPQKIAVSGSSHDSQMNTFFVADHGWHTDLIIRAADLNKTVPELKSRFHGRRYYALGWGDAAAYEANRFSPSLMLEATFWSRGAALLVVGFRENPAANFPDEEIVKLHVRHDDFLNMMKYVRSSFATDSAGDIIPQRHGLDGDNEFYSATGKYSIFNTCNTWTAKALYSGGVPIDRRCKFTASSVMNAVKKAGESRKQNWGFVTRHSRSEMVR